MISTTTNYGNFTITGYTDILTISIRRSGDETPQELVKKAIMFANEYKCSICRQVEYTHDEGVTFQVKCDSKTSRFIYEYGKSSIAKASVTAKDLKAYKANFGTDGCVHKDFVKKYWYTEPFHGETLYFDTLEKALASAKTAYGDTVTIWTNMEMENRSHRVCEAKASGTYLP